MLPSTLAYSFKVWIMAIFIGPGLLGLGFWLRDRSPLDWSVFTFLGYSIMLGVVFSIPGFFLFWVGAFSICGKSWPVIKKRLVMAVLALVLSVLTFLLVAQVFGIPSWRLTWICDAAYFPALVAGIFLNPVPEPEPEPF